MAINPKWVELGLRIVPMIFGVVETVERFVDVHGKDKEDAAVTMVKTLLSVVEAGTNRDLVNDDAFESAVRECIQAYVAVQNLVAAKRAK